MLHQWYNQGHFTGGDKEFYRKPSIKLGQVQVYRRMFLKFGKVVFALHNSTSMRLAILNLKN